jgi:hypothetical protein
MRKQNVGSEDKMMNVNQFAFSHFISASYFVARNTGAAGGSVSLRQAFYPSVILYILLSCQKNLLNLSGLGVFAVKNQFRAFCVLGGSELVLR